MQQFVNVNEVIKPKYVRWGRVNCREERKGGGTTRRHLKEAAEGKEGGINTNLLSQHYQFICITRSRLRLTRACARLELMPEAMLQHPQQQQQQQQHAEEISLTVWRYCCEIETKTGRDGAAAAAREKRRERERERESRTRD